MGKSISEDIRKEKSSLLHPLIWPVDILPLLDKGLFFSLNLSLRCQWIMAHKSPCVLSVCGSLTWPPRGLTRPPRADAATAAPAPTPDYVTLGAGPWSPAGSQGPEQGHRG